MSEFAKLGGETTANWFTRLVCMDAPQGIRTESEKEKRKAKNYRKDDGSDTYIVD